MMFTRTIAYLVSDSLRRLVKGLRDNVLTFEDAKRCGEFCLTEFAKMFEGHMLLYRDLKTGFRRNVPAEIFREAALTVKDLKTPEELSTLLEKLQRYVHKIYDWIDWSIPWFKLEKEVKTTR